MANIAAIILHNLSCHNFCLKHTLKWFYFLMGVSPLGTLRYFKAMSVKRLVSWTIKGEHKTLDCYPVHHPVFDSVTLNRIQRLPFPTVPGGVVAPGLGIGFVQSLSCVQLFATPWIAAYQTSLSQTISWNLPKLRSIELMMPSNHLILCCPLPLLSSIFPSIRVFYQWVSSLHHVAKVLELQHQSFR